MLLHTNFTNRDHFFCSQQFNQPFYFLPDMLLSGNDSAFSKIKRCTKLAAIAG